MSFTFTKLEDKAQDIWAFSLLFNSLGPKILAEVTNHDHQQIMTCWLRWKRRRLGRAFCMEYGWPWSRMISSEPCLLNMPINDKNKRVYVDQEGWDRVGRRECACMSRSFCKLSIKNILNGQMQRRKQESAVIRISNPRDDEESESVMNTM